MMINFNLKKALLHDTAFIELSSPLDNIKQYITKNDIIIYSDTNIYEDIETKELKHYSDINIAFFERKYFTNMWLFDYNNLVPYDVRKQLFDYVLRYGIADKVISIH